LAGSGVYPLGTAAFRREFDGSRDGESTGERKSSRVMCVRGKVGWLRSVVVVDGESGQTGGRRGRKDDECVSGFLGREAEEAFVGKIGRAHRAGNEIVGLPVRVTIV
jgi:hypothetical protein